MTAQNTEIHLRHLFKKTFEENRAELKQLMEIFNISLDEFEQAVLAYTLAIGNQNFRNKKYSDIAMKLVLHFHNLVRGTYHKVRHQTTREYLINAQANNIIDIGYGVPSSYMFEYLDINREANITLADQDRGAEEFSQVLIKELHPNKENRVRYIQHNMDSFDPPTGFDTYIMLDSIEHCIDPTKYLNKLVEISPEANYIFSIPISDLENFKGLHYEEWKTTDDADKWLNVAGLEIRRSREVHPNPDVDFFAESFNGDFFNYLVLCKKTTA